MRFGPAQEYSYVLRLRGESDAETVMELRALENARIEVLTQIGQALEIHAEDLDREAIREATNEALREIARAERELREIQRDRHIERAEIEREREEALREHRALQDELRREAREQERALRELQRETDRTRNTTRFEFRIAPPQPETPPPPPER
jgi:uncharacterized membrane protein YccC